MTDDLRPPYRIAFDNARDPYTARNALGITGSGAGSYQPIDATLTALAAYNTNGLLTQTAADTFTGRTLTGPAAGITVSNGNGVAGNPTLALANDLAALEALAGTNTIPYRSGTDTWAGVTVGSGLTFTSGTLAASAAPGSVPISTTTISSGVGAVDVTLPSGYSVFEVEFVHVVQNSNAASFNMQMAIDGGAVLGSGYYYEYLQINGATVAGTASLGSASVLIGSGINTVTTPDRSGRMLFYPNAGLSGRGIDWISTTRATYAGDGTTALFQTGGYNANGSGSSRATLLRFFPSASTFASGTILLRGIV